MKVVWSAVMLAGLAARAFAAGGDDDEKKKPVDPLDRIDRLEKELKQLREENEARKAGLPTAMSLEGQEKKETPKTEVEFKASFTDGFHLKSTDGAFDLDVGGRWEEEYRYTFNRYSDTNGTGGGLRTSVNSFYVREAFITMDGTLFKNWGFKINGDFTPQQTATVPPGAATNTFTSTGAIVEEYYLEWKELKELRIIFGSFKQPASFEITDSPRFAKIIQRSPMARFEPNFDTGIKVYGSIADSLFTYELAVTNGRSHLVNQGRGQTDDNDGKEYAVRLTSAPFVGDKDSFLSKLRFGGYATFAHEGQNNGLNPQQLGGGFASAPATNIATNELGVTYLAIPGGVGNRFYGDRYRIGGEFTYAVGPVMFRGEVMGRTDEVHKPGSNQGPDTYNNLLVTMGYYGELSFLLTGEDELPNARVVPKHPFSLADGTWGAFELVARYGGVAIDRGVLQDLGVNTARPANGASANSNHVSSITFGFNWWPVQNVRMGLDYVAENYKEGNQVSPLKNNSHEHGLLARFQVDF